MAENESAPITSRAPLPLDAPSRWEDAVARTPAAGAEASADFRGAEAARVHSFRVALTTDATVANRLVALEIVRGGVVLWRSAAHAAQTASTTITYQWTAADFFRSAAINDEAFDYIPELRVRGDAIVRTVTTALQAGDQYGAPVVVREVWIPGERE